MFCYLKNCQKLCLDVLLSSGIGPKRAIDLIKQYKSIEEIVKHIDTKVRLFQYRSALYLTAGLSLTAGDRGFPPATQSMAPGYFRR